MSYCLSENPKNLIVNSSEKQDNSVQPNQKKNYSFQYPVHVSRILKEIFLKLLIFLVNSTKIGKNMRNQQSWQHCFRQPRSLQLMLWHYLHPINFHACRQVRMESGGGSGVHSLRSLPHDKYCHNTDIRSFLKHFWKIFMTFIYYSLRYWNLETPKRLLNQ